MMRRARLFALLTLLAAPAVSTTGCSLILDPENCSGDSDCEGGGVCKSGICVGGSDEPAGGSGGAGGTAPDAEPGGSTGGADQGPPGGTEPDVPIAPPADMGVDADMAAPDAADMLVLPPDRPILTEPPTCTVINPPDADDGLVVAMEVFELTVQVTDPDTPPEGLTATVNSQPVGALAADGTALFSGALVEGPNGFLLEARDAEGHRCMARRNIVRDTTGPTVEITVGGMPIGNNIQLNQHPVQLDIQAIDEHGVQSVEVTARGNPVRNVMGPVGDVWTAEVNLADGDNPVVVTVTDTKGNRTALNVQAFFDGEAPEVAIVAPVPDFCIEENTTDVRGTVSDNLGVAGVRLSLRVSAPGRNPVDLPMLRPNADGSYRFVGVPLFPGDNTLTLTARDSINETTVERELCVEPGSPTVAVTEPEVDDTGTTYADANLVHFEGTASRSVAMVQIGIVGNEQDVEPEDGRWAADVRLPSQGRHVVRVVGVTPMGRESPPVDVAVVFDDSPPTIRLTAPSEGFCTKDPTMRVEGDAVDLEVAVPTVVIHGGAQETPAAVNAQTRHFRQDIAVNAGMDQTLRVTGENIAGLSGEATRTFHVDRTGPALELDLQANDWVAADEDGNIEIRGTVADEGCGLALIPLLVNGIETLTSPEGEFVSRQNRGLNPHITVVARDIVGNESRADVDVRVDPNPPLIEEVEPEPDVAVSANTIRVAASASDAESGLAEVQIAGVTVLAADGRYTRNVALVPGPNDIVITARDNVGLVSTVTLHINRDTAAPTVEVTWPPANANVEDRLTIAGTVSDGEDGSGVQQVEIGNTVAIPDADGRWQVSGVSMIAGLQTLGITAVDRAGNRSQETRLSLNVRDFGTTPGELNGLAGAAGIGWVGAADLDADGKLDILALGDAAESQGRVFKQLPSGAFEAHPLSDFGLPDDLVATQAAFGDFNADERFDLVVAGPGGTSTLYFGDRTEGFVAIDDPAFPVEGDFTGVTVGDINRDGRLDMLLLAGADSALRYGEVGGGATEGALSDLDSPDLTGLTRAVLIDVNTDGVQDLFGVGAGGSRAWRGETDGTFLQYDALSIPFGDQAGAAIVPVDADRDRDLDLITVGTAPAVHTNTLTGDAVTAWTVGASGLPNGVNERHVAAGDLDGDARDDLVVFGENGLTIFGGGAGGFTARALAGLGVPTLANLTSGALVDIDGDSDLDILAAGPEGLTLVRSNATTTKGVNYTWVRVLATRSLTGTAPKDSVGVVAYADYLAVPAFSRALVHPVTSPLVITFGGAARANVFVQWIERDGGQDNSSQIGVNQRPQAANSNPLVATPGE